MDSVPQVEPSLLFVSQPLIKESIACLVIGAVASTGVYGITVVQAYMYFRKSGEDSRKLRSFVAFLFLLDTITLVLSVDSLYEAVVTDLDNPLVLLNAPARILLVENGLTVLIGSLTQCFFANRIWALSEGNIVLVSSIVILSLCYLVPGIGVSIYVYFYGGICSLETLVIRIIGGFGYGVSAVCDVIIAAALFFYLRSKRTGFRRTDSIIDRLIIYAVNRGALTAIFQAGVAVSYLAFPGRFIFAPFILLDGKLYCNTLLATLNAQRSMRQHGEHVVEFGTQILNRINREHVTYQNPPTAHPPRESDATPTDVDNCALNNLKRATDTPDINVGE